MEEGTPKERQPTIPKKIEGTIHEKPTFVSLLGKHNENLMKDTGVQYHVAATRGSLTKIYEGSPLEADKIQHLLDTVLVGSLLKPDMAYASLVHDIRPLNDPAQKIIPLTVIEESKMKLLKDGWSEDGINALARVVVSSASVDDRNSYMNEMYGDRAKDIIQNAEAKFPKHLKKIGEGSQQLRVFIGATLLAAHQHMNENTKN